MNNIILNLICITCISISAFAENTSEKNALSETEVKRHKKDAIITPWSLYSFGIYYKNMAVLNPGDKNRGLYLDKALDYFKRAAENGLSLDRLYSQLSECHYYRFEFDKALDYARKSIETDKKNSDAYKLIYKIYMDIQKPEEAAAILEEYLKVNPDDIQIQFALGEHYYMKLNNINLARDSFTKVIAIAARIAADDEYVARSYYFIGYIAYTKGNYKEAISSFSRVLEMNKDNLNVVYMLSVLHLGLYQLDDARVYGLRYLDKKPDDPLMHAIIGIILYLRNDLSAIDHLRIGKNASAIDGLVSRGLYNEMLRDDNNGGEILEKIIKIRPDIIAPHIALARISMRKNKTGQSFNEWLNAGILTYQNRLYSESQQCFTEALAINKGIPGLYYYLGKTHEEMGNISQAIVNYKMAYTLKPENDLMLQIGYLYAVKQDYNTAFSIFDDIQAKEPKNSKPYFFRGLMYIWKEDYREAEIDIKKAISLDENTEPYYFYLAVALEKMKKIEEATQSLEKAIASDPESGRSHNFLGYLYADNSINLEKSIMLIQRALELDPENGAYIDSLGWVYYRQGNFKTAIEHLHRAEIILEKNKTPDPAVYDHLGDAYDKIGNGTRAVQYWKKAFEMNDDRAIQEKIKRSRNNTDEQ